MSLFVAAIAFLPTASASRDRFTQWFPQWQAMLMAIIKGNCSAKYQEYLTQPIQANCTSCLENGVVNCLLQNFDEAGKAKMQSTAVLLGLTPSMLLLIGSSTAETSLLSLQRPLLAFLIAAGSPSVNPIRAFQYNDPVKDLKVQGQPIPLDKHTVLKSPVVAIVELAIALGAVANIADLGWRLGTRAISSFSVNAIFLPLLWNFVAVLIHVGGSIALRLMVEITRSNESTTSESTTNESTTSESTNKGNFPGRIANWMLRELQPCIAHKPIKLIRNKESLWFLVMCWVTSTGTVIHIIFGTLVFSSELFISVEDGAIVILRYIISALVCNAIVMYELAGMRLSSDTEYREKRDAEEAANSAAL